ncbi:MAG: hypothetical protein ACREIE_03545 [Nitrospiraceae bacterium]
MTGEEIGRRLLSDLTDVIRWTDDHSARSQQATIGPSELGVACDRRIAYRLAGAPEINTWMDPWPAIVGTAIHTWLEKAVSSFQAAHHMSRWQTEITVHPDPLVVGHCDLYDSELKIAVDFKTVSPSKLKQWQTSGPSETHKDQVSLYARGLIAVGKPVDWVALVAFPRSGWLNDAQVWIEGYDPTRGQRVLDRMYGIADTLINQGEWHDFAAIPASPGGDCAYCPWYRGGCGQADLSGCPGNSDAGQARFANGLTAPK